MKNAFIIHGAYGHSQENWNPWLKAELEKLGYKVTVPDFPTPENQTLENWLALFDKYINELSDETILIGHSLGCPFILNVLEKYDVKVKASFFASGFAKLLEHPVDKINETFVNKEWDWEKIKNNCEKFTLIYGDTDPYIKLEIAQDLAKNLNVELHIIKDGGHLGATAGFNEFPYLLKLIEETN